MSLDSKTTFLKISVVKSVVVTDLQLFFFFTNLLLGFLGFLFGDSCVNTATEIWWYHKPKRWKIVCFLGELGPGIVAARAEVSLG